MSRRLAEGIPEVRVVAPDGWLAAAAEQVASGHPFSGLFGIGDAEPGAVAALFGRAGSNRLLYCRPPEGAAPDSLVPVIPAAAWDERAAHDLHGIAFAGHQPLRPLVAHDPDLDAWTVPVRGEDVHQVAVGPIHAGIIESGHFRFHVVGERVLQLDLRLFYKHRGLERAAEGRGPQDGLRHVARACGACAVANAVAFAHAWESAAGWWPEPELARARTLLLELERLYNHLNDIAAICAGVGFTPGNMGFAALKERAQRVNERLTGHRFLFGLVDVGASRLQIGPAEAHAAREDLRALGEDIARAWRELQFVASLQERLDGVGVLSGETALRLGAVGPIARASGVVADVRSTSPRLNYRDFTPTRLERPDGDVAARFAMRGLELPPTLALLDQLLAAPLEPAGTEPMANVATTGWGVGRVESPRGETVCVVRVGDGRVARVHLRTASYAGWPLIVEAVRGELLPDFPLINKSFELCYACCDR